MRRLLLAAAAVGLLPAAASAVFGPDTSSWPTMHGGDHHVSTSSLAGVKSPMISWSHVTPGAANSRNFMGVVVGSNGTIYVGGRSVLEALNQNGTTKWTANEIPSGTDSWGTPFVGNNGLVYASSPTAIYAYSAAGSGAVSFVSSAAALSGTGTKPGGAGGITFSGGTLYLAHGDETYFPPPAYDQTHFNTYWYNQSLTPVSSVQGAANSILGRSAIAFDGANLWYGSNGSALYHADTGAALDYSAFGLAGEFLDYNVMNPGLSIRTDGTWLTTLNNSGGECGSLAGSAMVLAALKISPQSVLWRKCDIMFQAQDEFYTPVSSNANTTFVYASYNKALYAVDNTGATEWSYDPSSFGFTPTPGGIHALIGQPTLLGGTTLYFTYCPTAPANTTRLVALNAGTGVPYWDVPISSFTCALGQPVPTGNGTMAVYNGSEVIGLEDSGAVNVAYSSSPAAEVGDFWYSTVTAAVTKAGGVAVSSGTPIEISAFQTTGVVLFPSITPSATSYVLTNTSGLAKFPVQWKLPPSLSVGLMPGLVSTITFRSAGQPAQTFYLRETRPASVVMSSGAAAMQGSLHVSTITFTVRDGTGSPVPNVPCKLTLIPPGAVSMAYTPDLNTIGFVATNGAGQASIVASDNIGGLASSSYAAYAATVTAACLDQPPASVFLKENRVATVTYSTGTPTIVGTVRVSTLTFTLRDSLGAGVPGVPVVLDLVGTAPGAVISTAPIPNFGLRFSTTDVLGQVKVEIDEDLGGISNTSYAGLVSTFTLRVLSHADVPVYVSEQRPASVSISSSVPALEYDPSSGSPSVRISTLTLTVRDASGAPVPNVPVWLDNGLVWGYTTFDDAGGAPLPFTDASGQTRLIVQEFVDYSSLSADKFAGLVSSFTVNTVGLADNPFFLKEERVQSVSVTTGAAVAVGNYRVFSVTVTVRDALAAPLPNIPVGLTMQNFFYLGTPFNYFSPNSGSPSGTSEGLTATNAVGVATFTVTQDIFNYMLAQNGNGLDYTSFAVFDASYTVNVFQHPDAPVDSRENRAASYSVSVSSSFIQPDLRFSTITVTVRDSLSNPVPNVPIAISSYTRAGASAFERLLMNFSRSGNGDFAGAFTNAAGQATFTLMLTNLDTFDNYGDFPASVTVVPLNLSASTTPFVVESDFLDHYQLQVPTSTSVGVSFTSTITALNVYSHQLSSYTESGVTLTPLFTGTNVQGSGSLGTSVANFSGTAGSVVIGAQTYNKIENIQIKATRGISPVKTGLSGTLDVLGPTRFVVSVPTSAPAGGVFTATITAVDGLNNPIVGYGATLSLTPVVALATGTPATGNLTPAAANMPANGRVLVNNLSYNKGDSIQIKVVDSALGISGFSSSMTITQPALAIDHYHIVAPASVTVGSPFSVRFEAMDASSAPVSYSITRTLNIQAFLANTSIAGSGSLGVPTLTLTAGATQSFTASQTYNKIETVQLKVTDDDGRVGLSSYTITFTGPTQFVVAVPTAAQAGAPFQFVVQAQDSGNNQVLGYNGTVSVAAVDAATTTLSGGGILGVTSLNFAGGAGSSSFQSYTKAQGIRFRVTDSGIGVTTISSSMTVVAGPPATLTLGANPQSTIATVPSILTALAADAFNNPVAGSTVTFTVASGSAVVTLGLVNGAVAGASGVVSTQAPTNVSGTATAFFGSTATLFSQADLVSAQLGSLTATTTIYNAVLISGAGGVVANQGDPKLSVTVPASTWGFSVRMSVAGRSELPAADLALTTAAFASQPNMFVSTTVMRIDVTRDSSPGTPAGAGGRLVSVGLPYAANASSNVTVGNYRGQSVLVPLSVLRVFKLNKQTSIFEMVLDGVNLPQGNGTISAQAADPEGIFTLGVPPFVTLGGASSGTVTSALPSGAMATVSVPFGAFATATTVTVSPLSGPAIPALPGGLNLSPTGIAISINTNGVEPSAPVGVSLGYTPAAIAGLNQNQLRIARYDTGIGWKVLDSQVDTAGGTVTAQTDSFSLFEIVAAAPSASVASGFVFPNPFRPSLGHMNVKFMSLPAAAHIRIMTVSGRLLKELDADSTGSVLTWNGADKDGRPLASGVYLAVVSDTAGGSGKATIKFAVQR